MQGMADAVVGELLSTQKCVLVVVDAQRWFLAPEHCPFPGPIQSFQPGVKIIAAARKAGVPVVWTASVEGGAGSPETVRRRWAARPGEPVLDVDDPAFEFVPPGPEPAEPVFLKHLPGGQDGDLFGATMSEHFRAGRSTAVICGAWAGRCVLAVSLRLQSSGFDLVAAVDAVVAHPSHPHEHSTFVATFDSVVGFALPSRKIRQAWLERPHTYRA